jgi:hypothetical protein
MSCRNRPQPEHRSPHEQHLREIVDEIVPDEPKKQAYLAFARELAISLRRGPKIGDSRRGTRPRSDAGDASRMCPQQRVGLAAVQSPFSAGTKRVVQKYFERGLHGHLLWLVGQAVTQERLW